MYQMQGTYLDVQFSRVIDGDTIEVFLPNQNSPESLRILSLDTEESFSRGSKPVTPWGLEAKERAKRFFMNAETVTIEFPGNEPVEQCIARYRGNFGRLLVFVYRDGVDFQETMISEGYSPYFTKYGNAIFHPHHQRYVEAERVAQINNIGVWNQQAVNQQEFRNYATLSTWWALRANAIDEYRALKSALPHLLNTRLDYDQLLEKAATTETVTVFTELSGVRRVGGVHGLSNYGSDDRPFNFFIPSMDDGRSKEAVQLMYNRYISQGETLLRRNYAYVTGELSLYNGTPQMIIRSAEQISDKLATTEFSANTTQSSITISALLPNPDKTDAGHETVTLRNIGAINTSIEGWYLQDRSGRRHTLSGMVNAQTERTITLPAHSMTLNNTGDEVKLLNALDQLQSQVSYTGKDVVSGQTISFTH